MTFYKFPVRVTALTAASPSMTRAVPASRPVGDMIPGTVTISGYGGLMADASLFHHHRLQGHPA